MDCRRVVVGVVGAVVKRPTAPGSRARCHAAGAAVHPPAATAARVHRCHVSSLILVNRRHW